MIGFLSGTVVKQLLKSIILQTSGGVGYEIFPTANVFAQSSERSKIEIYITTVVRESEISLYGFQNLEEKTLFEKLITVSGIGPKMALQLLALPPGEIARAVEHGEVEILTQIPGIGKKLAQKLILEFKGKLDLQSDGVSGVSREVEEAIMGLENLGYRRSDIQEILKKNPQENISAEKMIKYFLSQV